MLISYAQNFEDVILSRALSHIECGFYIDIGAQDPVVDSVSLVFHQRGWGGIHIEPTSHYASLLREQRPGDRVLQVAVGKPTGVLPLYEFPGSGISTLEPVIAERHRSRGFEVRETSTEVIALSTILRMAGGKDIHWMKIDVEGFEKQVLASWGNSAVRPWIVVVEATLPLTQIQTHESWESLLTGRGYEFAYFDGLNRFYVSEKHKRLKDVLAVPPNVFDGFGLNGTANAPFHRVITERFAVEKEAAAQAVAAREAEVSAAIAARDELARKMEIVRAESCAMQQRLEAALREKQAEYEAALGSNQAGFEAKLSATRAELQKAALEKQAELESILRDKQSALDSAVEEVRVHERDARQARVLSSRIEESADKYVALLERELRDSKAESLRALERHRAEVERLTRVQQVSLQESRHASEMRAERDRARSDERVSALQAELAAERSSGEGLNARFSELEASAEAAKVELERSFQAHLAEVCATHEKQLTHLKNEHAAQVHACEQQIGRAAETIDRLKEESAAAATRFRSEREEVDRRIREERRANLFAWRSRLDRVSADHAKKVAEIQAQREIGLAALAEREMSRSAVIAEHASAVEQLRRAARSEQNELVARHVSQLMALKTLHEQRDRELNERLTDAQAALVSAESRLLAQEKAFHDELAERDRRGAAERDALTRANVASLSLVREETKARADAELTELQRRFVDDINRGEQVREALLSQLSALRTCVDELSESGSWRVASRLLSLGGRDPIAGLRSSIASALELSEVRVPLFTSSQTHEAFAFDALEPASKREPHGDAAQPSPPAGQGIRDETARRSQEMSMMDRPAVTLNELLALYDEDFVRSAYLTLLRRPADPAGLSNYVGLIRRGVSREQILTALAASPEGRGANVPLPGLAELVERQKPRPRSFMDRLLRRSDPNVLGSIERHLRMLENRLYLFDKSVTTTRLEVGQVAVGLSALTRRLAEPQADPQMVAAVTALRQAVEDQQRLLQVALSRQQDQPSAVPEPDAPASREESCSAVEGLSASARSVLAQLLALRRFHEKVN
jgi:FkbM family methyltransferase